MHRSLGLKLKGMLRLTQLLFARPAALKAIRYVKKHKLTYLGIEALADLADAVNRVSRQGVPGSFHEAGCALGGSAILIAAVKPEARPMWVYDTFERIPPPSQLDGQDAHDRFEQIETGQAAGVKGSTYYGYRPDLLGEVEGSFSGAGLEVKKNQIHLTKGLFQDTLRIDAPVAFAHLDCDWYESVMTCLTQIEPQLSVGGVLVIDDYQHWSGCRKAIDEYFADKSERYNFMFKTRLHIQRIS